MNPDDPQPASNGWTILVVDDETEVRDHLCRILALTIPRTRCVAARNGKDALDTLALRRVDLIVSDQRMPGMDGVEFLSLAAKRAPHVPRILLTGFADVTTVMRALNDGRISAFFEKPARNEDITKTALVLLEKHAAENGRRLAFDRSVQSARALLRRAEEDGP